MYVFHVFLSQLAAPVYIFSRVKNVGERIIKETLVHDFVFFGLCRASRLTVVLNESFVFSSANN